MDVDRDLACSLGGVHMHECTVGMGESGDFRDGLHRPRLIVGEHHGHQGGVAAHRLRRRFHLQAARSVHWQHGELPALRFQPAYGLHHRRVFDRRGDQVAPLPRKARPAPPRKSPGCWLPWRCRRRSHLLAAHRSAPPPPAAPFPPPSWPLRHKDARKKGCRNAPAAAVPWPARPTGLPGGGRVVVETNCSRQA